MDSWPNQEALNKALNIYRTYMRAFIIFHLKKIPGEKIEDVVMNSLHDAKQYNRAGEIERELKQSDRDIKSIIDVGDFPHLIRQNWSNIFEKPLKDDKDFRNQLWLVKTRRDKDVAHPPEEDVECESTRVHMFLMAEVLRKINRPDKQCEVEAIRDELFFDDTAERLAEAEERLKIVEAKNAEYKKSIAEAKKRSKDAGSEKNEYIEKNAVLLQNVDEKEKQRKKLDRNLKNAKERNNKLKSEVAGGKKRLEESEEAKADYKTRLDTKSKELKDTKGEWKKSEERLTDTSNELAAVQAEKRVSEECLVVTRNLLTTVAISDQSVFPPLGTDFPVRILDRRGMNKKNYLLKLLEQKQPAIIYVQSEEKINQLLGLVGSENAKVIGKHDAQTSDAQEMEILEKLENGELIAVVSNATFSALASRHCVEHLIFCHLTPGVDKFFKQCEPAFTSAKNAYLHLIYESKKNIEEIAEMYPSEAALRTLYQKFKDHTPTERAYINLENLCNKLCQENELNMTKLGIKTGFSIFEELGFLEQNKEDIRRLSTTRTELKESKTYRVGDKLKKETVNCPDFQYEHSVEQLWEEIQKKVDIGNERILRENNISTELEEITVESLTESVEGISETTATETTEKDRNDIAVQVVELRINAAGLKPLAWKRIREKLGLKHNQFHKDIRPSAGYRKAVIDRIKSLKAQEGGWEYSGKLDNLTGIDDISEDEL